MLPAITLGLFQMTLIMRLVRAEMLEVLRSDYIKFARARGLSDRAINFGHALKNTLVPVITIAGLQFGGIVAFSIVTESVFQWPGMGLLLVQSIAVADIPVMSAYLLLISAAFRRHQPGGRPVVLRRRSAAAHGPARRPMSATTRLARLLRQRPAVQFPPLAGRGACLRSGGAGLRARRRALPRCWRRTTRSTWQAST